jgi:hypothetical protein
MDTKLICRICWVLLFSQISAQSVLVDYPGHALQGGLIINLLETSYGPGVAVGGSFMGMVEVGVQYSYLYEKDGNYTTGNIMSHFKYFPLKPFWISNFQPSLEFYYLSESYYLKNFTVENDPRRYFYRLGGSFAYRKKLREVYTVIPELGIFRTVQKLEGVNLRVEGLYPVHFIYNDYRDTNHYVEVKFSFSLIRPLAKNLDLVIQFQNFMNRDEFQDQFLLLLVGYF